MREIARNESLGPRPAAKNGGPEERRWQEQANCLGVDPDLFFPERGASTKEAKAVCRGCEVRVECLEYALSHRSTSGIWGGRTERARRPLQSAWIQDARR